MGRVFLHSPRIRCGGKHGQYFANAGPLYIQRIIVCVLIFLQGIRFNDTLPNWSSKDTMYDWFRIGLKRHAVPEVPLHIILIHTRCGFATCINRRKGWFNGSHLFVFSSPEPKAQVSFSDQNLSVVRRCRRRCCRKLFTFPSSSPEPLGQFQRNLAQSIPG